MAKHENKGDKKKEEEKRKTDMDIWKRIRQSGKEKNEKNESENEKINERSIKKKKESG